MSGRAAWAGFVIGLGLTACSRAPAPPPVVVQAPVIEQAPPPAAPPPTLGAPARGADGVWTAPYGRGKATLTLEGPLQDAIASDLALGRPQWGAVVIVDTESGKVLALAEHSEREPALNGVLGAGAALHPRARAASVFKIVTSSALLRAGVSPDEVVCFSGGKTRMHASNYVDNPRRDTRCVRFEDALPLSQNVAMAKLAGRYLTPQTLRDEARAFGLNDALLSLELPIEQSFAAVPDDDVIGFVETAAGFGEVRLSALHGAMLAAIVGGDGVLVPPTLIERVEGEVAPHAPAPRRVLDETHARILQSMLTATVERGTATRAFSTTRGPYGRLRPLDVSVAGKTGSLTDRSVDLDTTWFVGTAPAHDPKIAIGVAIINDEWIWHVRALDVARRALEAYFTLHPEHRRTQAVAHAIAPSTASAPAQGSEDAQEGAALPVALDPQLGIEAGIPQ